MGRVEIPGGVGETSGTGSGCRVEEGEGGMGAPLLHPGRHQLCGASSSLGALALHGRVGGLERDRPGTLSTPPPRPCPPSLSPPLSPLAPCGRVCARRCPLQSCHQQ